MKRNNARKEIAAFRATEKEKELYLLAGEISIQSGTGDMSDVLRGAGTIAARSIVGISAGTLTLEAALDDYKTYLLSMLPSASQVYISAEKRAPDAP